ncbi:MAG: SoxR reducing system RseC family protein [Fusobacteriaceae bacterium]|nr:SoxR reducing system RseC family protein [Fusobacteriaceae bacterium]
MESKGVVTEHDGRKVKIKLYKETACDHCESCSPERKFTRVYTLFTDEDVAVGDTITMEISGERVIKASLILYALPVLFLFLGYYVGSQLLGYSEGKSVAVSFAFLLASFLGIFFYDKATRKNELDDIRITHIERF